MNKGIISVLFFIIICFIVYLIFSNINFVEGMTNDEKTISSSSGIAGSAENYAADIKSMTIKNQDILLISKYRKDYENSILNLDDLINTMMLQTTLAVDKKNPMTALNKLVQLNSAKTALNSVMKYVDSAA